MLINGKEYASETINIRISIGDLTDACRTLGETQVVAAGSIYATLKSDLHDRKRLTRAGIHWTFD